MTRFLHPLLLLLVRATESELVRMIEYLKAENRILRSKLPKRIKVTQAERAGLVKLGMRLGTTINELITIVHPRTFARWICGAKAKGKPRRPGRPRKPEEIRELIVQMATNTGWGYKRILGELKKLRIRSISRSTVARILQEHGFDPGPKRGAGTWHDFVQRHVKTLWATDFFTKKVWTPRGLVEFYVLFFIHIDTRRVHVAGLTANPDGPIPRSGLVSGIRVASVGADFPQCPATRCTVQRENPANSWGQTGDNTGCPKPTRTQCQR
jgi:putative transposase